MRLIRMFLCVNLAMFLRAQDAVDIVARATQAVAYEAHGGTRIGFKGTDVMPESAGEANVRVRQGRTEIDAILRNLARPGKHGAAFLTYVLWAISPAGRSTSLGEI